MKKLLVPIAIVGLLTLAQYLPVLSLKAAPPVQDSTAEIVKALNIQNQQLDRIADALERISGQQPGWKLPSR
jgi:hypothetical protein